MAYTMSKFTSPNAGVVVSNSGNETSTTTADGQAIQNIDQNAVALGAANTFTLEQTMLDLKVSGLTGATAASRYVGATASGAPASGTFAVGDFILDQTGKIFVCTVAGTPGTWVSVATTAATTMAFTTGNSTVGAGSTVFIGLAGAGLATEANAAIPVPTALTFTKMYITCSGAATAGQSFTYTLRKTGVDTAITTSISGASAQAANDTAHSVSFAAGDTIDVKLVTSGSAAAVIHQVSLSTS